MLAFAGVAVNFAPERKVACQGGATRATIEPPAVEELIRINHGYREAQSADLPVFTENRKPKTENCF
jgi:hypothetical protein